MNSIIKQITSYNNLYWAYQKVKNIYKPGDIWYDELELSLFEADLGNNLEEIRTHILNKTYELKPIRPVGFPKSSNEEGPRTRQSFWIAVRDQVTWLAVTNIVGRFLDAKMPFWSYGNRLYISMFYGEGEDGKDGLQYGYYRNTTRYTYRKWSQSWPLYRRHINLTSKLMSKKSNISYDELDDQERLLLEHNDRLSDHPLKADYLKNKYWKTGKRDGLYWAGLDLEKFYPKLNLDIVQENLVKYLPEKHQTPELAHLFKTLLDFETDLSGWSEEELVIIQLGDSLKYRNLPTGLFVAGFLSNVALLGIDEQVSRLLKKNKNIAHFRYVDDHLILSTNFEELLLWISTYKKIIDDSNIGTAFNQQKTEPNELGNYFSALDNDESDTVKIKENAKKQMSLDPDFPSPLMTQTLAKVSKIAGTAFNLLTADEEKNLVTDIEHLLVTDFPDHELKKGTRVSFAARMLSSIVPNITVDSAESYRLHRVICIKVNHIQSLEKKISEASVRTRVNLEMELSLSKKELIKDIKALRTEENNLENEEGRLASRTSRLLLKAVSENHDKVRLWGRLIEFFFNSGSGSFLSIFDEIKKLKNTKETNDLSVTFLHAIILQVLTNHLFNAIRVLTFSGSSFKKKNRAISIIKNLFQDEVFLYFSKNIEKSSKFYERQAYSIFRFGAGSVLAILNRYLLLPNEQLSNKFYKRYGLFNIKENPNEFFQQSGYNAGVWAWWLYSKLPPPELSEKPYLWDDFSVLLGNNNEINMNVLLLHPRHINHNLLNTLHPELIDQLSKNEALWYEVYKYASNSEIGLDNSLFKAVEKKISPKKVSVSVDDWIRWMHRQASSNLRMECQGMFFDPRLGEWMALEMIRQIAQEVKDKIESSLLDPSSNKINYYQYIHPHNFKVPKKWINNEENLTWEGLSNLIIAGQNKIQFRAFDDMIIDNRFVPHFGLEQNNENQAILHALGSILISLLSKNSELPNKWNPKGLQPAWMWLAMTKLKDITVSTYTRDIISGCYSNRNIESQFNLSFDQPDFIYAKDTSNDPPDFRIIDDFLRYVDFALKKLKNQQLSVSSHQPRQLTPISIMQLKRLDYQQQFEQEEID